MFLICYLIFKISNPDHKLRAHSASSVYCSLQTFHSNGALLILQRALLGQEVLLLVGGVSARPIVILEVSAKHVVVGLCSEYSGPLVTSPIRQPLQRAFHACRKQYTFVQSYFYPHLAQFNEIIRHFGRHVRPQLEHHSEGSLVVHLDFEVAVRPICLGDRLLGEGDSFNGCRLRIPWSFSHLRE